MLVSPSDYYTASLARGDARYVRAVSGSFEGALAKGERKRLKRAEKQGFFVAECGITDVYPVIADNRARKGRQHGMTFADWEALKGGGYAHGFAVFPGTIAAAFCVMVRPDTLYVSAWGDAAGYEKLSPVVLLAKGIYDWCAVSGISVMDIGVADEPGLIAFKERLGFRARIGL